MSSAEDETGKDADLRFTAHQRNQVRVERDLSGGGHLARGDKTKMSRLNFSARARPADPGERDSAFTSRPADVAAEPASASAPAAEAPPTADGPPAADSAAQEPGLIDKVARFFGR